MRIKNCCREIRIQAAMISFPGDILEGVHSSTGEKEKVFVIKIYKDYNETVVQKYTDEKYKKFCKYYNRKR